MVDFKVQILAWYLPDESDKTCGKSKHCIIQLMHNI